MVKKIPNSLSKIRDKSFFKIVWLRESEKIQKKLLVKVVVQSFLVKINPQLHPNHSRWIDRDMIAKNKRPPVLNVSFIR